MAQDGAPFVRVLLGFAADDGGAATRRLSRDDCARAYQGDAHDLSPGERLFLGLQALVLDWLVGEVAESPGVSAGMTMPLARLWVLESDGAAERLAPELLDLNARESCWTFRAFRVESPHVEFCGWNPTRDIVVRLRDGYADAVQAQSEPSGNILRFLERLPQKPRKFYGTIEDFHADWSCYGDDFFETDLKESHWTIVGPESGDASAASTELMAVPSASPINVSDDEWMEGRKCILYDRLLVNEVWHRRCFFQPCVFARVAGSQTDSGGQFEDYESQEWPKPYRARAGERIVLLPLAMFDVDWYGQVFRRWYKGNGNIPAEWHAENDAETRIETGYVKY